LVLPLSAADPGSVGDGVVGLTPGPDWLAGAGELCANALAAGSAAINAAMNNFFTLTSLFRLWSEVNNRPSVDVPHSDYADWKSIRKRWNYRSVLPVCLSNLELATVEARMNGIIYLIGLIVVVMAILSFLGLH